ncbi:MAG: SDR family NAD(P)-dependent oxidoreductase [Alphaproteobacteria bacterium]
MVRFEDRVCIITGGASGIGAETARQFVHEGGKVVIGDVDDTIGEALAVDIGEHAIYVPCDVSDPAACAALVTLTIKTFGRLDGLVNSAIRMGPVSLADLSLDDWSKVVDVGLTGTFLMTQAAGRWWIEQGQPGAVVNMSSTGGLQPYNLAGAYSTTKAGVIMLSKQFGLEWARHNIRVNTVCPGHTETPLTAYMRDPAVKQARADVTPLGRVGQPDDIAEGILYLLSDAASYVTSSELVIDGGMSTSLFNHMPGRKWD